MREIIFRGKLKKDGVWAYGNLNVSKGGVCVITPGTNPLGQYGQVDPETVGQYTGLTDKNGMRIFEGDVTDILTENNEIGVVAWEDGSFCVNADGFCLDFQNHINGKDLEVIGNIQDNPELLEV